MNYLKIALGIFAALAASRFIPHPPNFTSLLALSFYIPALLGAKYILAVIFAFVLTDSFIGLHSTIIFTWGSVAFIGLISKFFIKSISTRIFGSLLGACSFYLITNFGVWSLGSMYEHSYSGLILCYTFALPFFAYSLISTFIFSAALETLISLKFFRKNLIKIKSNF